MYLLFLQFQHLVNDLGTECHFQLMIYIQSNNDYVHITLAASVWHVFRIKLFKWWAFSADPDQIFQGWDICVLKILACFELKSHVHTDAKHSVVSRTSHKLLQDSSISILPVLYWSHIWFSLWALSCCTTISFRNWTVWLRKSSNSPFLAGLSFIPLIAQTQESIAALAWGSTRLHFEIAPNRKWQKVTVVRCVALPRISVLLHVEVRSSILAL